MTLSEHATPSVNSMMFGQSQPRPLPNNQLLRTQSVILAIDERNEYAHQFNEERGCGRINICLQRYLNTFIWQMRCMPTPRPPEASYQNLSSFRRRSAICLSISSLFLMILAGISLAGRAERQS